MWSVMEKVGAPKDLFERATGHKRIESYETPEVTFVDAIFENMLRAARFGHYPTVAHKYTLEEVFDHCRHDRRWQFVQVWTLIRQLADMEESARSVEAELSALRERVIQASAIFTKPTITL
jgi:hypothetical protein